MAMVRFSIQPSSRRRATKAFVQGLKAVGSAPRNPMVGSFPVCCELAASGQNVTAPAMVLTKSRRLIAAPVSGPRRQYAADYSRDLEAAELDSMVAWCRTPMNHYRMPALGRKRTITACRQLVHLPSKG